MEYKNSCLLSIIVPVYNVEEYLRFCLDSLLNQDFENYEIVCVNDGSSDDSLQILSDYAKKYSNIKVIDKENGGVSSARNTGINYAEGEWIWFVDSDDYIPRNCLGYLMSKIENAIDYISFDVDITNTLQVVDFNSKTVHNEVYMNSTIECLTTFPTKSYGSGPWAHIWKREIILENNLAFDVEMKYSEDTKFMFEYRIRSNRAKLIDGVFYCYYQRPSSAMDSLNKQAHFESMRKLVSLYYSYSEDIQDDVLKQHVRENCVAAVKAVQFDLLYYIKDFQLAKNVIDEYEAMGIYPYKTKKVGKNKNKKQFILNIFYKTFNKKNLYLFLVKAWSKLRK